MPPKKNQNLQLASVLYGVVAALTALLAVEPDQFTIRNVVWGGTAVGLAATLTYYFKEIVHEEADRGVMLDPSGYVSFLALSVPVLAFPAVTILIAAIGISLGTKSSVLIAGIFYVGVLTVAVIAFAASYRVTKRLTIGLIRAGVWVGLCLLLYLIKLSA